ncbi:hypothetical protein COI44_17550 [Bacillus sp. AFS088145]|nr:hypothetical protein COI44_17550 [Bacillus sp. AFS088145]
MDYERQLHAPTKEIQRCLDTTAVSFAIVLNIFERILPIILPYPSNKNADPKVKTNNKNPIFLYPLLLHPHNRHKIIPLYLQVL